MGLDDNAKKLLTIYSLNYLLGELTPINPKLAWHVVSRTLEKFVYPIYD